MKPQPWRTKIAGLRSALEQTRVGEQETDLRLWRNWNSDWQRIAERNNA
ncbi:MAG: hypothetical protein R3C12_12405 [Planctomycetaceae bacterium]